jgi:hypothetical protein
VLAGTVKEGIWDTGRCFDFSREFTYNPVPIIKLFLKGMK